MDTSIFLDINRLASRTAYLHGVLGALAGTAGLALLAALLVLGLLQGRFTRSRPPAAAGALLVSLVAVAVTAGLGEVIGHLLARARPEQSLKGIEVIGSPQSGFSLPDLRVAAGAAIAVALLALGLRLLASLTLLATIAVGFAEVYVGAHFPVDELAALGLGLVVALLAVPLVRRSPAAARGLAPRGRPSLTAELAGLGRAGSLGHAGPAATPVPIAASGAVRLLEAPPSGEQVGTLPRPRLAAAVGARESPATTWSVVGSGPAGAASSADPQPDGAQGPQAAPPGRPRRSLTGAREGDEGGGLVQHPRSNIAVFPAQPEPGSG